MSRPLIGITCATLAEPKSSVPFKDQINAAYSHAVRMGGGIPVLLPNHAEAKETLSRLDGVLLSGGVDVQPSHYGEATHPSCEVDPIRNDAELALIREAVKLGMPILTICRGIQSLNVALGGSLYQHLPEQLPSDIGHRQTQSRNEASHTIRIEAGSLLAEAIGAEEMQVNSFHHQAVARIADGFVSTAHAPDGVVEAIQPEDGAFVLAVQFHPEEMVDCSLEALSIFRTFVRAASG